MANATMKALADDILNAVKGTSLSIPGTLYVALLTTAPTTNTGTSQVEASYSGYARQAITSAQWSAISQSADTLHDQISSTIALTWPAVAGAQITVNGVAIYDAATSGNELMAQSVTTQAVAVGNQYSLPSGQLIWEA